MVSISQRTRSARKLYEKLQQIDEASGIVYWEKAEVFYEMSKDNLWKFVFGEGVGTLKGFLEEIHVPPSTFSQRVANYKFYVLRHKFSKEELAQYDTYSLYNLSVHKPDAKKTEVRELMGDSRELGRQDFLKNVRGSSQDECLHEHTHEDVQKVEVCDACKAKLKRRYGKKSK